MSIIISQKSLSCFIPTSLLLLLTVYFISPTKGFETRKLDETGVPGSSDPSIKCGGCSPCGNPSCYSSPPPPSLPPPPPPSPPPPPPPKKPPTVTPYCPPPPSSSWHNPPSGGSGYAPPSGSVYGPPSGSGFVYTTAPPGELYPVIQNSSSPLNIPAATMQINFCIGLLGFFILWT